MNFFQHIADSFVAAAAPSSFVTTNLQAYYDANTPGVGGWNSLHNTYNPTGYARFMGLGNGAAFTTIGGVNALYLDGVNDYGGVQTRPIVPSDPMNGNALLNFTTEIWMRSNGAWLGTGNFWAITYNQATRTRWGSSGPRIYAPNMDTFSTDFGAGLWTTNVWHHYTFTMENLGATNDRFIVYRNGVQIGIDTTGNYAPSTAADDFYIGTWNGSGEFQRMYVGLLRRYNIALTAAEVLQNFNAEKTRFGY